MRLALFSDVHGNRFALEAVLKDIKAAQPDQIANLGDQVWGAADPAGAWALQQGLDAVQVRGNTDEMVSSHYDQLGERAHAYGSWLRSVLPYDATDTLAALPTTAELAGGELVIAHGGLTDPWEALLMVGERGGLVLADEEVLLERAKAFPKAKIFVVGHTHTEIVKSAGGLSFVNGGPVSRQYDQNPQARWTLLEKRGSAWSVSFKRVEYDVGAAIKWAQENSPYSDEESKLLEVG